MARMTRSLDGKKYILDDKDSLKLGDEGYYGDAIERLARFENFYDYLIARQKTLTEELEKLRGEDKTKSYKFKEALSQKMLNEMILTLLRGHDLK